MITDTIRSCISAINQKQNAVKNKQSVEDYQKTLASLSIECQGLERSIQTINSMQSCGMLDSALLDSGTKDVLLSDIDQCGIGLENGQLSKEAVQVFSSHVKQLQHSVSLFWRPLATHFAESVTGYLGIVQGFSDNPNEVAELRSRIEKSIESEPTATSVKKLYADVTQARSIIAQFSLRPEIEAFLKKVADKKATVMDLSPDILAWITEKGLQSKLKIHFS